jgi:ATP-dependent DNA helicase
MNQLDFLLSKASEYSNFIAKDLEELQQSLSEQARVAMEEEEESKKKRKGTPNGKGGGKKSKSTNGSLANEQLVSAHVKDAASRAAAKDGLVTGRPIFVQPKILSEECKLKDYQLEGVRWLASLYENGVSGILADEMGLGKTIQVIGLIAHLLVMGVSGPFLIVAPLATLPNWVREFEKWLPSQKVIRYHGSAIDRESYLKGPLHPKKRRNPDFPFIVTSYEVAIRDQAKLEKLGTFTYLVVDEGHRLKNHRCTLLASLKRLKAANRLLLSGTPIQNSLDELWYVRVSIGVRK